MSLYTEHSEKWKTLSDVDYFTQFVKAWIPFNAWYKTYYPDCDTDRVAINTIKTTNNKFRNRLVALLSGGDNEGDTLRSHVANLHYQLERTHIYNRGERITFESVIIETNPRNLEVFSYVGFTYRVERHTGGTRKGQLDVVITDGTGNPRFSCNQNAYDSADLEAQPTFHTLSPTQQAKLRACYAAVNPHLPINLMTTDSDSCIPMGTYRFVSDTDKLAKGIVEVLYNLRNSLFHGTIIPDKEHNKVYEPAYHILHTLVQSL
jgi:hypothetical protein